MGAPLLSARLTPGPAQLRAVPASWGHAAVDGRAASSHPGMSSTGPCAEHLLGRFHCPSFPSPCCMQQLHLCNKGPAGLVQPLSASSVSRHCMGQVQLLHWKWRPHCLLTPTHPLSRVTAGGSFHFVSVRVRSSRPNEAGVSLCTQG